MEPPPTSGPARYFSRPGRAEGWVELDMERIVRVMTDGSLVDGEHVGHRNAPQRVVAADDVAQHQRQRATSFVVEIDQRRCWTPRQDVHLVGELREPRNAGEEMVTVPHDAWSSLLVLDDVAQKETAGPAIMGGRHLRLTSHRGVHERPGVDLAVRVGVRRADDGAAVLEDEHVRHIVERLKRFGPIAPGPHDRVHLVVGEVGHASIRVMVVADDLGRPGRPSRPVEVIGGQRLRCVR